MGESENPSFAPPPFWPTHTHTQTNKLITQKHQFVTKVNFLLSYWQLQCRERQREKVPIGLNVIPCEPTSFPFNQSLNSTTTTTTTTTTTASAANEKKRKPRSIARLRPAFQLNGRSNETVPQNWTLTRRHLAVTAETKHHAPVPHSEWSCHVN